MSEHYDQREALHAAQKDAAAERVRRELELAAKAGCPDRTGDWRAALAAEYQRGAAEQRKECDALKAEVGRLWDYACHKGDCEADDRNDEDCTCGLLKVKP